MSNSPAPPNVAAPGPSGPNADPNSSQQQQASILNMPSPSDLDKIVLSYLQKKGYKATERIFLKELEPEPIEEPAEEPEPESSKTNEEIDDPEAYDVSYKSLREWIENSLDWYKPELRSVLFPIFVHAYLDLVSKNLSKEAKKFMETYKGDHVELHTPDLNRLATVTDAQHVRENELAQIYRSNKYNLRMSSVPFELFLNYLQDNKFMLLLRIVNQYLNIQVVHGKLLNSAGGLETDDVIGITGHESQQIEAFNQQPVQLGQPQPDPSFKEELEQALKDKDNARKDEMADQPFQSDYLPLLSTYKKLKQDSSVERPAFGDIPLPPYKGTDLQAEIDSLEDVAKRIPLGPSSLPSICCYTFHNTHDNLNCVTVSKDASLVAGGFSESFIKIWSLKGEKLRALRNAINPAHVNDYADLNRQKERHGSDYKRLVGHSGPVYGVSFSPDNKYLVSCSEDKTARLWSTQTFSNLVIYKGHNHPVWDVDFGPFGFYFATASHDRTARLWSCDHITSLRVFAGHLSDVDTVKFHPNSKYLVTGSSDRTVRMWDVQTGACVRVFTGHTGGVKTVAVSPNGKWMASAGEDKSIIVWDLSSGKRLKCMTGHTDFIYSVAFSADNNVLVSSGADCTVRMWDVNEDSMDTATPLISGSDTKRMRMDYDLDKQKKAVTESREHLAVFPTKYTPIYDAQFTNRNLCIVAGAFCPPKNK